MTIAPGTLCLIVAPHPTAGCTCTVNRRLTETSYVHRLDGRTEPGSAVEYYDIENAAWPARREGGYWAHRSHLVPLAPPGDPDSASIEIRTGVKVASNLWIISGTGLS